MKKLLAVLLASLMVFNFVACGNDGLTVQKGKLIMATSAAFPPYEYIADDGKTVVGIDPEIAKLIADEMGLELVIEDMAFSSIITAVQSGKVDFGMAGMTVNEDRLKNVNFCTSYSTGTQVIIVPEGSDIKGPEDLVGKKIGVQEATVSHQYCKGDFGEENITAYVNAPTAVQALIAGKVECVVTDSNPANAMVAANPGLVVLETEYITEDYAACFSKENEELLAKFNEVLDAKIKDGSVQKIIDKYINTGE